MWTSINQALNIIDNFVWGVPLMVLIIAGGLLLTIRLGLLQIRKLPLALKWMLQNEEGGKGEISSFSALCTALSATIEMCIRDSSYAQKTPVPGTTSSASARGAARHTPIQSALLPVRLRFHPDGNNAAYG